MQYSIRYAESVVDIPQCDACNKIHLREKNILLVCFILSWIPLSILVHNLWPSDDEGFSIVLILFGLFVSFYPAWVLGSLLMQLWQYICSPETNVDLAKPEDYPVVRALLDREWQTTKPSIQYGGFKSANANSNKVDDLLSRQQKEAADAVTSYRVWCSNFVTTT